MDSGSFDIRERETHKSGDASVSPFGSRLASPPFQPQSAANTTDAGQIILEFHILNATARDTSHYGTRLIAVSRRGTCRAASAKSQQGSAFVQKGLRRAIGLLKGFILLVFIEACSG